MHLDRLDFVAVVFGRGAGGSRNLVLPDHQHPLRSVGGRRLIHPTLAPPAGDAIPDDAYSASVASATNRVTAILADQPATWFWNPTPFR